MSDPKSPDPVVDIELSEEQTGLRTSASSSRPSAPTDSQVFEPGTVIIGRYRIINRIGKGGMGEVYRVQDLTLDQEVALKFLPEELATSPRRQALFHNEVRIARRVTHPNVCRIFDIGELDGRLFLSMEFVKGEDLSSLLRRVGRLTEERGLEVARQLCGAMTAAHEQGVIHRDLKPANILIDENGQVRITDFGLAGVVGEIDDVRSGTPAYMAPEQLRGQEVSTKSDLFAIGAILFELFTGQKAFEAGTLNELLTAHSDSSVRTPSSLVKELSPATEQAILQCLDPDPERRPTSALDVAAMLPGGDPLREALAAGRTPSPDLVAAAGKTNALPARLAGASLLLVLVGMFFVQALRAPDVLINRVPFDKPPAVLIDRARTILSELGHPDPPHDIFGMYADTDYFDYLRSRDDVVGESRWSALEEGRPAPIRFWYRSSPTFLEPTNRLRARPSRTDPPLTTPGMTLMELDWEGRLLDLVIIPPDAIGVSEGPAVAGATPDWGQLLEFADVDSLSPTEVDAQWTPPVFAEKRRAWTAFLGETPVRLEASALNGSVNWFRTIGPWDEPRGAGTEPTTPMRFAHFATWLGGLILAAGCYLAYRNHKSGRSDHQRALRLGMLLFGLNMFVWTLRGQGYSAPNEGMNSILGGAAQALLGAVMSWLFYMALEPYARRIWPQGLIGWTRLFSGHYRDPRVGRDVLFGALFGTAMALAAPLFTMAVAWLESAPTEPVIASVAVVAGFRYYVAAFVGALISSMNNVFLITLMFVLAWMLVRRVWIAIALMAGLLGIMVAAQVGPAGPLGFVYFGYMVAMGTTVLWRFGLLATTVALFFEMALRGTPFANDFSAWYASPSIFLLSILSAITVFAFVSSRAGEPLFGSLESDALVES